MYFSVVIHLSQYRFRPKFSEETFSAIHGDAVTEQFDKKSKETAEPYQSEYISRQNTVNKWDLTSHIHAKMRTIQQEKTEITYSSQA